MAIAALQPIKVFLRGAQNDGEPLTWSCASGTAIAKWTSLKFADGRIVSESGAAGDFFAGFAAADKDGTDHSTQIAVIQNSVMNVVCSLGCLAGDLLATASPSGTFAPVINNTSSQAVIAGVAMDSVGAGERVNMRENL